MALLIIFEVKDERRRKALVDAIEHYGDCIRLAEGGYAIKTDDTPGSVYDALHAHLNAVDQLLVLPFTTSFTGGDTRAQQWLAENSSN